MTAPFPNNTPFSPDPDFTLEDVMAFVIKAKWFALAGIAIGIITASIFIAITPNIYESKIVIQIKPHLNFNNIIQVSNSDDLLERLTFSSADGEILQLMQLKLNAQAENEVRNAIKLASINKNGRYLKLTIKERSPMAAQELSKELGNAMIAFINQSNAPKISYYKKLFDMNKALLTSSSQKINLAELQALNLELESVLSAPELLQPKIADISVTVVPKKNKPILLLGTLLGLLIGLLWFYYKERRVQA